MPKQYRKINVNTAFEALIENLETTDIYPLLKGLKHLISEKYFILTKDAVKYLEMNPEFKEIFEKW